MKFLDEFIFEDVINMSALFVVVFDDSILATFVAVKVTLDVFAIGPKTRLNRSFYIALKLS